MADDSLPKTRAEAKAIGARYFFTGVPCHKGHVSKRLVSEGRCVACNRDKQQVRYKADPARYIAQGAEWAQRNRERSREVQRECQARIKADPEWAERQRQWKRAYKVANADKVREYNARHRRENAERDSARFREYYRANPSRYHAHTRKREASRMQRTPAWLTSADFAEMTEFYARAKRMTAETGIKHEVDHIVPLLGKDVCGLHVPQNLQILTRSENRAKSNKHGD